MALHEQSVGATDEWYTPAYVFEAMGCGFQCDPAHPASLTIPASKWCATRLSSRGLETPWFGSVWMNPPFGGRNGIVPWLEKFFAHGSGVALVPDRTSAPWWQTYAPLADRLLFVSPKIKFIDAEGNAGRSPAQGTALLAKGDDAVAALIRAASNGLGICFTPASPAPFQGLGEGNEVRPAPVGRANWPAISSDFQRADDDPAPRRVHSEKGGLRADASVAQPSQRRRPNKPSADEIVTLHRKGMGRQQIVVALDCPDRLVRAALKATRTARDANRIKAGRGNNFQDPHRADRCLRRFSWEALSDGSASDHVAPVPQPRDEPKPTPDTPCPEVGE